MLDWRKQKVQEICCVCFLLKKKKSLLYHSSTMNMHMSTSRGVLLEGSGADTPHRRPMPTWSSEVDPWAGMPPHGAVWCGLSTRWNFDRWCSSLEASSDVAVTIAGANDVLLCSQWSSSLKKLLTETPVLKGSPALLSPKLICGNQMGNKDGTPETPHKHHSQVSSKLEFFISTSDFPPGVPGGYKTVCCSSENAQNPLRAEYSVNVCWMNETEKLIERICLVAVEGSY